MRLSQRMRSLRMQEASMFAEEICCILDIVKVRMSFWNKEAEHQGSLE